MLLVLLLLAAASCCRFLLLLGRRSTPLAGILGSYLLLVFSCYSWLLRPAAARASLDASGWHSGLVFAPGVAACCCCFLLLLGRRSTPLGWHSSLVFAPGVAASCCCFLLLLGRPSTLLAGILGCCLLLVLLLLAAAFCCFWIPEQILDPLGFPSVWVPYRLIPFRFPMDLFWILFGAGVAIVHL